MRKEVINMTDGLTDISSINKIYENAKVEYYHDEFQGIIKEVIKELYYSNRTLILNLKLKHIDRAIYKFKIAKEKTNIHNTKQYFKACIISAITETVLDELYINI